MPHRRSDPLRKPGGLQRVPRNDRATEVSLSTHLKQSSVPFFSEKDKSRENEYFFRGEPNDHYGADRHGQLFVKCKSGKIPNVQPLNSTRCMMRSADFLPACSFTHDYLNNESFYDCYDLDEDVDKACNDECDIKVSEHLSEVTRIRRTIGFCCCTTPDCNTQSKARHLIDCCFKLTFSRKNWTAPTKSSTANNITTIIIIIIQKRPTAADSLSVSDKSKSSSSKLISSLSDRSITPYQKTVGPDFFSNLSEDLDPGSSIHFLYVSDIYTSSESTFLSTPKAPVEFYRAHVRLQLKLGNETIENSPPLMAFPYSPEKKTSSTFYY